MTDPAITRRVPAEWEPQCRIWLSWPHQRDTWPGRFDGIPEFFVNWARLISETTPVTFLAGPEVREQCLSMVSDIKGVAVMPVVTNDCWIRDYGPTFVIDETQQSLIGINWRYNAWGGKYSPWDADDAVAKLICSSLDLPIAESSLCLEGGALEVDGQGRLLTTPTCLITPTRNPEWSKSRIVEELRLQIGIREICWLDGGGLQGDDTDGHIDQLARFVDTDNVVVAVCDDPADDNHAALEKNFRQIQAWAVETTPSVNVHRLRIPPARKVDGKRVPESYCNFLRLGPDRLLMPSFGASSDDNAVGLLRELTTSEVIPMDCRELIWGLGALHCGSRDQPA